MSAAAHAEQARARRVATASKVEEAPLIDGVVDDDVWESAEVLTGFIQAEPFQGQGATEKTEVRILYDDTNIYVGAVLHDSDPAQIIATDARRDAELDETDSFRIIFDTYRDRQNGFVFGTNPSGLEHDGQVSNEGQGGGGGGIGRRNQAGSGSGYNLNWDTSFRVATQRGDYGWSAEFAIPAAHAPLLAVASPDLGPQLPAQHPPQARGALLVAGGARLQPLPPVAGRGPRGARARPRRETSRSRPYALGATDRNYATDTEFDGRGDVGVDAKFGITQAMNLDLTYNTDFAQVEVDEQQINLTRFSLFFPEKRPFFLENAGYFQLGSAAVPSICSSAAASASGPSGQIVPIVGGGRVSGKAGALQRRVPQHADRVRRSADVREQLHRRQRYSHGSSARARRSARSSPAATGLGLPISDSDGNEATTETYWHRTYGVSGTLGIGQNITVTELRRGHRHRSPGRRHPGGLSRERR